MNLKKKIVIQNDVFIDEEEYQGNKLKILIADDYKASELLLTTAVKKFGKEVLKAKTGDEAIEACLDNPDLDLVLMDIKMPEMDGYEATRQIRLFNPEVVIIDQTAFGITENRGKSIKAGCTDYISISIKKEKLMELMQKYFNK